MIVAPLDHNLLVQAAQDVPPLPQTVLRLAQIFEDEEYSIDDVIQAIEMDGALSARLLQAANSSLYGTASVGSVDDAVVLLGSGVVKSLAISAAARPQPEIDLSSFGLTAESYWNHCVTVLCFAEVLRLQHPGSFNEELATAALLHDFGKLILAKFMSQEQTLSITQDDSDAPRDRTEMAILGVSHSEVTAVVCQSWKLPEHIVRAMQYHHNPAGFDNPLTHGLNIANQLAWQLEDQTEELNREADSRYHSMVATGLFQHDWDKALTEGTARRDQILSVYS